MLVTACSAACGELCSSGTLELSEGDIDQGQHFRRCRGSTVPQGVPSPWLVLRVCPSDKHALSPAGWRLSGPGKLQQLLGTGRALQAACCGSCFVSFALAGRSPWLALAPAASASGSASESAGLPRQMTRSTSHSRQRAGHVLHPAADAACQTTSTRPAQARLPAYVHNQTAPGSESCAPAQQQHPPG